jgi:hypothetical protein
MFLAIGFILGYTEHPPLLNPPPPRGEEVERQSSDVFFMGKEKGESSRKLHYLNKQRQEASANLPLLTKDRRIDINQPPPLEGGGWVEGVL